MTAAVRRPVTDESTLDLAYAIDAVFNACAQYDAAIDTAVAAAPDAAAWAEVGEVVTALAREMREATQALLPTVTAYEDAHGRGRS
ncbi:hypothetical protein D1871_11275 [Nakamurella silvestris]|nr:hypothetical protein D1871_11275 [Nakamurella silvestris]